MWQTAGAQQGILSLLIISFWYSLGPFLLDLRGVFWFRFWEYIYLLIFHLCRCSETLESFPWMSHQLTFGAFLFILGAGLWMSSNVIYQRQSVICMLDSALLCSEQFLGNCLVLAHLHHITEQSMVNYFRYPTAIFSSSLNLHQSFTKVFFSNGASGANEPWSLYEWALELIFSN